MKYLYKEINTLRILPLDFMHNLGILFKCDVIETREIVEGYYDWAMGKEIPIEVGEEVYKAFCLLGDSKSIQDYNTRLDVWYKNNGQ